MSPVSPGARRALAEGLVGVRARGDERRRGQLRDRLLDREHRPDGRPHRRLVDGRAAADPAGRRVPAAARRGVPVRADGGRRDRRGERAVRLRARDEGARADRDEPARLAVVGARVEGDGLPDREARGAARGRLHARRAAERHHGEEVRRVRAGAGLRRGQGAALRLREVRRAARARHGDEGGRRVARPRTDVPGGVPQGGRGSRAAVRDPASSRTRTRTSGPRSRRSTRRSPASSADGDLAAAKRFGLPDAALPVSGGHVGAGTETSPTGHRVLPGQARRRLLRRRVRGADAVLLPLLRGRGRGRARTRATRSSCSAPAPTGSARASSSTTAASAPRRPSGGSATRR